MKKLTLLLAAYGLICPAVVLAQFTLPAGNIASYPLGKLPGSARCVGMGGACTSIGGAIDAGTYNPANLDELDGIQFSAQLRYSELDGLFLDQDALDSEIHGPAAGQLFKIFKETGTEPAYVGVGGSFGRWSISGHYQKQLEFSGAFNDEEVWDLDNRQIFVNFNRLATSIESVGVTASYRFSGQWTGGVTLQNTTMDVNSIDAWELKGIRGATAPTTGFESILVGSDINDDDSQSLVSVGVRYEPNERFSFGLSWRQGGDFVLSAVPSTQFIQSGVMTGSSSSADAAIGLPDVLALGAAWRPTQSMLFALDLEHISHSNLPQARTTTLGYKSPVEGLLEPIDDTVSVRLGFEKVFSRRGGDRLFNDYALRAGVYTEEDHDGMITVDGYDTHFTIGFGVSIGRERKLKLDMGFEFGDEDKNYLVSLTY